MIDWLAYALAAVIVVWYLWVVADAQTRKRDDSSD